VSVPSIGYGNFKSLMVITEDTAIASARLLGVLVRHLSKDESSKVLKFVNLYRICVPSLTHLINRSRALNPAYPRVSVLGMNAVLLESPAVLQESTFADDTANIIVNGIGHKNVRPSLAEANIVSMVGLMWNIAIRLGQLHSGCRKVPAFRQHRQRLRDGEEHTRGAGYSDQGPCQQFHRHKTVSTGCCQDCCTQARRGGTHHIAPLPHPY